MKSRKWYWAVLLSLLQPGLGHMYAGRLARGAALFSAGVLATVLAFWFKQFSTLPRMATGCFLLLAFFLFILIDSWRICMNGVFVTKGYNKWYFYFLALLLGVGISALVERNYFRAYKIPSEAMARTLITGDRVYVDMTYFEKIEPQVDDLVVYRLAEYPSVTYVKRIVAAPGDVVEMDIGKVRVNGRAIDMFKNAPSGEDGKGLAKPGLTKFGRIVLSPGEYFVLGDNPAHSQDSRVFGPIRLQDILGKPLYIYYSPTLSRIGNKL